MTENFYLLLETELDPKQILNTLLKSINSEISFYSSKEEPFLEEITQAVGGNLTATVYPVLTEGVRFPHPITTIGIFPNYEVLLRHSIALSDNEGIRLFVKAIVSYMKDTTCNLALYRNGLVYLVRKAGLVTVSKYVEVWTEDILALVPEPYEEGWFIL